MVIIWGTRLYGKTDTVPGLCHVATQFFHLWYIPLIPLGSYAVIPSEDNEDGWRGAPISMSAKSILLAWFRTFLVFATVVTTAIAMVIESILLGLLPVACIALMIATYRAPFMSRASYTYARELGHKLGLDKQGMLIIDLLYEQITSEEADRRLQQHEEQQAEQRAQMQSDFGRLYGNRGDSSW